MAMRALSDELRKVAESELNEDPERLENDLRCLREWLVKQPHLRARTDDQWLLTFLRGRKFSLQKTKEKLDGFYTLRTLLPEYFANRDPFRPEIQEVLETGCVYPLPTIKGYVGPKIVFFNCSVYNYPTITLDNIFKVSTMIGDILILEDDNCAVSGLCVLIDYKGMNAYYLAQCTPSLFKKIAVVGLDAYPFRVKNITCVNAPAFLQSCFQLFKALLGDKIKGRFFVYDELSFDKVYECIPKKALPFEMGGECGTMKEMATHWKKKIESYREWFMEEQEYRCDEAKRVGSPKLSADLFGVEGSFRNLNID